MSGTRNIIPIPVGIYRHDFVSAAMNFPVS